MGPTVSVKDLQHSEEGSIIFSTGLDRFLRVFEYKKNSEMPHIFLKNKLTSVLPIEVEWKPEDDELEYWEEEKEKNSDDMEENYSEDSDIEEEEGDEGEKELSLDDKNSENSENDDNSENESDLSGKDFSD